MRRFVLSICCLAALPACTGGEGGDGKEGITIPKDIGPEGVSEFGTTFTVRGSSADGLDVSRDLAFHPTRDELWTVNQDTDSTVIYFAPGDAGQTVQEITDPNAFHFMEEVSSIAFGQAGTFATCQESRNTYNGQAAANNFMGPVLWPDDLAIYGFAWGTEDSAHLDMLHESPNCMGIAWDTANVYWVFDGHNGHLVRYDFAADHGPGNSNHNNGRVRRFTQVELTRIPGVIGDMALDHTTGLLYIADPGTGRVLWVDTTTGEEVSDDPEISSFDNLAEYTEWGKVKHGVIARDLEQPSGLHLDGDRLFVTENLTNRVTVIDLAAEAALGRLQTPATNLQGVTLGPDGKLWYLDATANELVRIDP